MKKTQQEIIPYINTLKGFRGYVQFSHRAIDKDRDLFFDRDPHVEDEKEGFVYEAHFSDGTTSIAIRQINDAWFIDQTPIEHVEQNDIQSYETKLKDSSYKVKMAQVWQEEADPLCEGMMVKRLKKVVFAGFEKGGKQ